MLLLALGPALRELVPAGFDPRWLYALQVVLPLSAMVYLWPSYGELRATGSAGSADWLMALGTGILVFLVWIRLDAAPWVLGTSAGFDPRDEAGRIQWALATTRLLGAVCVVPMMEELFWRSFVLRWIARPRFLDVDPRSVGIVPLVVSSALFASEHHLWLAGLLAGLAYGWLYRRTGNLWMPTVAHAVTNAALGAWVLATGSWTFW